MDSDKQLEDAILMAKAFHALTERNQSSCQLDLMLVYERCKTGRDMTLYPVNTLRNYARLQARSPLIGLFDADMLTSRSLFEDLKQPDALER